MAIEPTDYILVTIWATSRATSTIKEWRLRPEKINKKTLSSH
jgi:hypothetical protein